LAGDSDGGSTRIGHTCDHQVSFGAAEDLYVQQTLCLCLSKGRLEIAVKGILDVLLVQTTFLVDFSVWRRGHDGKGGSEVILLLRSPEIEKGYFISCGTMICTVMHPKRRVGQSGHLRGPIKPS